MASFWNYGTAVRQGKWLDNQNGITRPASGQLTLCGAMQSVAYYADYISFLSLENLKDYTEIYCNGIMGL